MVKRIALAPKLDTAASAELRTALQDARDEDVLLDASEVEMLGALCLELLMSAGALWKAAGHSISIENVSAQMGDDLGRFGLSPDNVLERPA